MNLSSIQILAGVVVAAYFAISAPLVKKDRMRHTVPWSGLLIVVIGGLACFGGRLPFSHFRLLPPNAPTTWIGTALEFAGLALAVWGRYQLGAYWSSAASVKEGHELVVSGPYRLVRHPIYAGFLWAILGAALLNPGLPWIAAFVILATVFTYRMRAEEKLMAAEFPGQYAQFQRNTKRLIPLVW